MALFRVLTASTLLAGMLATIPSVAVAGTYSDGVMSTPGLVSYWRLGEASGTTAADEKGANPGTYQAGFQLGQPGALVDDTDTSASFDGSGAHVSTPFTPTGGAGSIEFWGYADALDGRNGAVYTRDDGSRSYSHQVGLRSDGSVRGYMFDGARRVLDSPAGAVATGEWHHYVLVWETGNSVSLYLDGQLQDTEPLGSPWAQGNKFLLGGRGGKASRLTNYWQGRLDEFAVYNSALPAATVEEHYELATGEPPPPPPPPEDLEISAQPALYPAFDRGVSDYVSRCEPGNEVQVSVAAPAGTTVAVDGKPAQGGTFTEDVALSSGQRFPFTVNVSGEPSTTHNVRCLPQSFPGFTSERSGPTQSEWYIVTPTIGTTPAGISNDYVAIFDSNGVPVWWMLGRVNQPLDAKLLPNGNLAWLFLDRPSADERMLDGPLVRRLRTVGDGADHHDIQLLPNGNYLMAKYYQRSGVDLTFCGGSASATILDNQIQEITPTGQLVWSWNALDHLPLSSELSPKWYSACTQAFPDVYHFNSMEDDGDGMVISLRHEDAVYRIDRPTGAVDWKVGGTNTADSLTVVGDPAVTSGTGIFGGQHDARIYSDGTLTVHDNGTRRSRPPRSVRYSINEAANTATLLEEVTDLDAPNSGCCGGSRKLPGGNWVMSWGQNPLVTELTPAGDRVFKLTFAGGLFSYRANPVPFGTLSPSAVRGGMDTMHPR
jgi:hypothetical protein